MLTPAVFGISNSGVNLAIDLIILFLVVIWLALVYWTYSDARRRIADPMLVGCATLCSLFPFLGSIVYVIVRPPEYLDDARERDLEIAAAEARLAELQQGCPYCGFRVEDAFLRGLTGEVIARFERKGLRIVALKHMRLERDLAERHYAEHSEKPFFGELVEFITSGPLVAMVLEGHEAIGAARQVIGATNP